MGFEDSRDQQALQERKLLPGSLRYYLLSNIISEIGSVTCILQAFTHCAETVSSFESSAVVTSTKCRNIQGKVVISGTKIG
jgi:hypothetical protein